MANLDYRGHAQLDLLSTMKREVGREIDKFPDYTRGFSLSNDTIGSVDAELLYAMIRHIKPKRIVQLGEGLHTAVIKAAVEQNVIEGQAAADVVTVDQYFPDFEQLMPFGEGDIIYADTSHIWVEDHEIDRLLKLMMSLQGVYVHFHDVFLPHGYPPEWANRSYTEQPYIEDFLEDHPDWEVVLGAAWLHGSEKAILKAVIPSYDQGRAIPPGSLWLYRPVEGDEFDATYGQEGPLDPSLPHEFQSDRGGKRCLVCGKTVRAKVHA